MFKKVEISGNEKEIGKVFSKAFDKQYPKGTSYNELYYLEYDINKYKLIFKPEYIIKKDRILINPLDKNIKPYYDYPLQTHSFVINDTSRIEKKLNVNFDINANRVNSFRFSYKVNVGYGYLTLLYSLLARRNKMNLTRRNNILNLSNSAYLQLKKDNSVEFNFKYEDDFIVEITFNYYNISKDFIKELYGYTEKITKWEAKLKLPKEKVKDNKTTKTYLTLADITNNGFPSLLLKYNINFLKNFYFGNSYNLDRIELDPKDIVNVLCLVNNNFLVEQKKTLEDKFNRKELQEKTYNDKLNLIEECEYTLEWLEENKVYGKDILNSILDGMFYYNDEYTRQIVFESDSKILDILLTKEL